MANTSPTRLGRLELLGAWLRIWTPPRGAVIPPVPWRKLIALAVALAAGLAVLGVLVLPDVARDRAAARERAERAAAARHAAFLREVDRTQTPRLGRGRHDPGSRASGQARRSARSALVASARSRIRADAATRTRKPIQGVACEPFPRTVPPVEPAGELARAAAAYDCVAVTQRFNNPADPGRTGIIGTPFRLVVHFDTGAFAWCQVVPLGDKDRLSHPLPRACRL